MGFFKSWWVTLITASISCLVAVGLGWLLVNQLRSAVMKTDKSWKITLPIFITPISVFLSLRLLVVCGVLDIILADSFSFGMVFGILVCLNSNPKGSQTVKLVAYLQGDEKKSDKSYDVWLTSTEVTVGEARNKIAEVLNVVPATRVCIESGQGKFIEDMAAPLFPIINAHESATVMDFFGYETASCYIFVKDEDKSVQLQRIGSDDYLHRVGDKTTQRRSSFMSTMLASRSDAKYGDMFTLTAKSRGVVSDSNIFHVQKVDKFVGAAPITMHQVFTGANSGSYIRFVSWDAMQQELQLAETHSMLSAADTNTASAKHSDGEDKGDGVRSHGLGHRKVPGDGNPIRNGDVVLLETDGMYVSVTKGWWLAWNSSVPRRSGAFVVEIVEKAQQQTLKEQVTSRIMDIKEKIGRPSISLSAVGGIGGMETLGALGALSKPDASTSTNGMHIVTATGSTGGGVAGNTSGTATMATIQDNILRPGDLFRLRCVKFPEFEIGVTIDRIRDGYCYIGLRKMEDTAASNSWCSSVVFSLKSNYLTNEMSKMQSAATGIINSTLRIKDEK